MSSSRPLRSAESSSPYSSNSCSCTVSSSLSRARSSYREHSHISGCPPAIITYSYPYYAPPKHHITGQILILSFSQPNDSLLLYHWPIRSIHKLVNTPLKSGETSPHQLSLCPNIQELNTMWKHLYDWGGGRQQNCCASFNTNRAILVWAFMGCNSLLQEEWSIPGTMQ